MLSTNSKFRFNVSYSLSIISSKSHFIIFSKTNFHSLIKISTMKRVLIKIEIFNKDLILISKSRLTISFFIISKNRKSLIKTESSFKIPKRHFKIFNFYFKFKNFASSRFRISTIKRSLIKI